MTLLVSVFSTKGGCGRTTVATNLAYALHAAEAGRVCLVDLDLGFGDVATTLQLPVSRTLSGVLADPAAPLAELVTPIRPGLDALLAPSVPGETPRISADLVGGLLDRLVASYQAVVVDTGAGFTGPVLAALDRSDKLVLLTTPERPALLNLRLTLDAMDLLGYPRSAREIVVNRSDSDVGITPAEVARVVRTPIAVHLPSSRDVPISINRGRPLVDAAPEHPVSQAIARLARIALGRLPDPVPDPVPDAASGPHPIDL